MGAVTYPESSVADTISEYLVPVQIDTQDDANKPVIERFRQVWTPDIRVLAPDGYEFSQWNGYLPPLEFLPRLLLGVAQARFRSDDLSGAMELFEEILTRFPTSDPAPEAQYYRAVIRYKERGEASDLIGGWEQLQSRYPNSIWRVKQSMIEG